MTKTVENNADEKRYINKRSSECGWNTFSFISFDYEYCLMCGQILTAS